MPRKKVVTTETIEEPEVIRPDVEEVPGLGAAIDAEETIQSFVEQFGSSDLVCKIYRMGERGYEYCFKTSGELDEDYIQESFGGGLYEVRLFVNNEKRRVLSLRIAEKKAAGWNSGAHAGASSGVPRQPGPALKDPNAGELQFLRELIIQTMAGRGTGSGTPLAELTEAVKTVHALSGGGKSDIDLVLKGLELAREVGGGGDWKTEIVKTLRDVAGPIAQAVVSQSAARGGTGTESANLAARGESMPTEDVVRAGISYLKGQSAKGVPVELVIDWVMAHIDEEQYQAFLTKILNAPFDDFLALDSDLTLEPHRTWFSRLHAGIKEEYAALHDSSGQGGNGSHTGDYGAAFEGSGKKPSVSKPAARAK